MYRFIAALAVLSMIPVAASAQSIEGVWRQVEVETRGGSNAGTIPAGSPGTLWIFADGYQSLNASQPGQSRPAPGDPPTDPQLAQLYRSYVAFAGPYELQGSRLTLHPQVALNPAQGPTMTRDITLTATTLETRSTGAGGVVTIRRYVRVR